MVKGSILNVIHEYLTAVQQAGINVDLAVLFGSYSRNEARADSDIDLIIVADVFDESNQADIDLLWELRAFTDARIEPIACGQKQWQEDMVTPLLNVARREGIVIKPVAEPA